MAQSKLIILTGASGAGKTTIAKRIAAEASGSVKCLYFDTIGVPSTEQMVAEFGSGWNWQRAKTLEWIKRIHSEFLSVDKSVLFEGQMQVPHIIEACEVFGVADYEIVLIDCEDLSRENRLRFNRLQPELANEEMKNWARFLKNQALSAGARVLDTSGSSVEDCVSQILALLDFQSPEGLSGIKALENELKPKFRN